MPGLLGLGGFGGTFGAQPPAGLLGKYYDPKQMRNQQLKQGLLQAGIAMLQNGKGSTGEVLGNSLAGGLQGAQQAGQQYQQDAYGYQQLENQQNEQREKERKKAAIMQWIDGQPENVQEFYRAFPEEGAKHWLQSQSGAEGFTLGEGQQRFDATGRPIASVPQAPPKPTSDIQNYEYYAQGERAAGRQPMSSLEYEQAIRKSGANSISIGGSDGNFDKELSKGVAGVYVSQMETGQNAMATKTATQQLRVLMKGRGGALDGLAAAAAPYLPPGLVPEGASDIVAAQAIIAGLVPKQRVPGSGTTSDFDARKFAESLPSLWNKPGANEIITNTMESYADYQIAVSNVIADVASNPSVTNKAAAIREQISRIPDPFIGWKQYMATSGSSVSSPAIDDLVNKYRSK
jgi:hypothetical protein